MSTLEDLASHLEAIARTPASAGNSFEEPAFVSLRRYVQGRFPGAGAKDGVNFALSAALDRLDVRHRGTRPFDAEAAAAQLEAAFAATQVTRVHLCPLDVADEVPDLTFGPNMVRWLSVDDLRQLFAPMGPRAAALDSRLAQFRWLIVHETVPLESEPGRRAFPLLYENINRDFAAIDPHERKFPLAVERALFALLLAPWEDLVDHADINWRAFQTPWSYTVDDDLFVRPARLPSADSLSWEPDYQPGPDGEPEEMERPLNYPWQSEITGVEAWVNDARWHEISTAFASDLFSTPVAHFVVAAFLGTGIDEFMGHLTALDAALGLRADRVRGKVLGARVGSLLGDSAASDTYGRLFEQRSEYVHGRPMTGISGADRVDARRLARRVTDALVKRAQSLTGSRDMFLQGLAPSQVPTSGRRTGGDRRDGPTPGRAS
jgi:hypothetical protein